MKKIILLTLFTCLFSQTIEAQIGIAVAKDEFGSLLRWQVVFNEGWRTELVAREKLEELGYSKNRIFTLTGGEQRGHNLTSGYWVVVECTKTRYDGKRITTVGLGASSNSYYEAEQRAVSNLSQYDWAWKQTDGYSIVKKGNF